MRVYITFWCEPLPGNPELDDPTYDELLGAYSSLPLAQEAVRLYVEARSGEFEGDPTPGECLIREVELDKLDNVYPSQ